MKKFLAMAVLAGLATLFVACDDKKADTKPQAPATQDASKPAEAGKPADTTATTDNASSTTQAPATQDASKPAETDKPSK